MVASDLDGTLLGAGGVASRKDLASLRELGELGIPRVIATGRSLYSARRALPPDFPVDFLVFSSGAGVVEWPRQELIKASMLSPRQVAEATTVLQEQELPFMVHAGVPENHRFAYRRQRRTCEDFERRLRLYEAFCTALSPQLRIWPEATQLVAITEGGEPEWRAISDALPGLCVVRTTSPLDGKSLWIEIFAPDVSKARGTAWVCERFGLGRSDVLALGNDYNDVDLLRWAGRAYVVGDAPEDLRAEFPTTNHHTDSPLTAVLATLGVGLG